MSGSEYKPQFLLQKYTPFEKNKSFAQAKVNQSASGVVEVISFGSVEIMECRIEFITDINQGTGSTPIETDLNGVDNTLDFLNYCITKGNIEFIPDRDAPNTYQKCLLESTSSNRNGTGFKLNELTGRRLTGYFSSGLLRFRKVN
jgi:hypothetical protein